MKVQKAQITTTSHFTAVMGTKWKLVPIMMVNDIPMRNFCPVVKPDLLQNAWMYGPRYRWVSNQWCMPRLLRAKRYTASSRNGVVGRRGRKIPVVPSPSINRPIATYSFVFTLKKAHYLRLSFILRLFPACQGG